MEIEKSYQQKAAQKEDYGKNDGIRKQHPGKLIVLTVIRKQHGGNKLGDDHSGQNTGYDGEDAHTKCFCKK